MFSRYRKDQNAAKPVTRANAPAGQPTPAQKPAATVTAAPPAPKPAPLSLRKSAQAPAHVAPADKEVKRRERLSEIRTELHKVLLDTLNLAALENAPEAELRSEIAAISADHLRDMDVVLNKEERATLHQELYDEVKGLGPLEPLLKDDTVNDILVNGPRQIFIERSGRLELTDVKFRDERHHRQDRLGRGPSGGRIEPLCGRPPRRRLALQRDGPAHRRRRQPRVDPKVQEGQARD